MATTRKEPAAKVEDEPRPFFLSEGVRQDLEFYGKATDAVTGATLELDRTTGKVRSL